MHIVLTDVLTCPRCGPEFGLILLADRVESRRVIDGVLGCSNCREQYPVGDGIVHWGDGGDEGDGRDAGDEGDAGDAGDPLRLGALLGVTHGPGFLLLAGPAVEHAAALAALIEDIEVIALRDAGATGGDWRRQPDAEWAGVSRMVLSRRGPAPAAPRVGLPLATGRIQGVALTGSAADALLEEGARVLSPVGRLVLEPAPEDAVARLTTLRLRVLARDGDTLVAVRY